MTKDKIKNSKKTENTVEDTAKTSERIAKRIASSGVCSRRDAERLIAEGKVFVNGEKLTTPAFLVSEKDEITVNGTALKKKETARLWCYHKPVGLLTTHKDPKGRPTVFENLPKSLPRVISVGRLDLNSEGLLLLTTSGAIARSLEHPSRGWKRQYRVRIYGIITPEMIEKAKKGLTIEGIHYAPCQIEVEQNQSGGKNQWLLITLTEGKNREIRKIMDFFGFKVARLLRVSYGPFQLGNLPVGEVREISGKVIKEQIGCV
ncbi:MAG: rRNA pseudouridine synthase [Alphaproteobacteria bacterium]|nr:rRNA pseudouridine synthase [Alphaproteobacteria bacterium]